MANPQRENGHTDIANEIVDHFSKIRISGEAMQVLWVILRKTYGWQKKIDNISLTQFVEFTNLKKPTICKALKKLTTMNIVTKKDNAITQKGNSKTTSYSFQKNYDKWKPLPKKVTLPKKIISVTKKDNLALPKKLPTITTITKEKKEKTFSYLLNKDFKELWEAWLETRSKKKIPNTERALVISLKKLHKHSVEDAKKMLEQAIERGWRGIFELKSNQPIRYKDL